MPDTPVTTTSAPTTQTPISDVSTFDLLRSIASSSSAKGAALGALMSNILGTISEPGGVVQPMDLSKFPIRPRTTTITPPRYLSYADYGTRDLSAVSPELTRQMGALSGLGSLVPASALSRVPTYMSAQQPFSVTSVGSGQQLAPTLSLTPRSTQQISPLTGALLGSAAGYLLPSGAGGTAGSAGGAGGTGGSRTPADAALGELFGRAVTGVKNLFTKRPTISDLSSTGSVPTDTSSYYGGIGGGSSGTPYTPPTYNEPGYVSTGSNSQPADYYYIDPSEYYSYTPDYSYNSSSSYYTPSSGSSSTGSDSSSYWGGKEGGMATPMMADGGEVEPSYYTYGTTVDPQQVMQQLAQDSYLDSEYTGGEYADGGYAEGGMHVPTVAGRHDYRAGSRVSGEGDGQSDDIPAMLADGEYVFDADTVAQLGNGSTKAGSDLLDKFREEIRAHKRSAPVNKIPPPSKSPLQYLKQAQSRSKKNG